MNDLQKKYYYDMAQKDRLFLFYHNNRKVCLMTFFITDDIDKYIHRYQWQTISDDDNGSICYLDHLWTDNDLDNRKISYKIWHYFKEHIRQNFPQVEKICWVRAKMNKISLKIERKTYTKHIKGGILCM